MPRTSPRARGAQQAHGGKPDGLTQAQLAEAVGCKPLAVSRWERGEFSPNASALQQLSKVLGCPMENLLQQKNAGE